MPKAHATWTVLPHGPLTEIADGVWNVDGTLVDMPLPRRMVVAKLDDGGLIIHNPIALDESEMEKLDALGPVRFILTPNGFHRLDSPGYQQRYPEAKLLCPKGARQKVAEVARVDGSYADFPDDSRVRLEHLEGVRGAEGVMIVAGTDGTTLVFNDAMFNLDHMSGVFGFIYGRLMGNAGQPRVTTVFRLFVLKDKKALRANFERLAELPGLARILVSHGNPITEHAAETLRGVASRL